MEVEIPAEPKKPKTFKLCETNISQMPVLAVVAEFKEIEAALGMPYENGWYGFSSAFQNRIESRLMQLRLRLADEYIDKILMLEGCRTELLDMHTASYNQLLKIKGKKSVWNKFGSEARLYADKSIKYLSCRIAEIEE